MKVTLTPKERKVPPESIIKFVRQHIHSVEQLEVLLLLHGSATREWSAAQVNLLLKSDENSVGERLQDLYSRKLLTKRMDVNQAFFRFPENLDLEISVTELKEFYKIFTVRMIEIIYSSTDASLKDFSDSFRIRKK